MPEIGRRFHVRHLVGIALLAILPVVGAFGLLETGTEVGRASSPGLDIVVEYPTRVRATHRADLRIVLTAAAHQAEGLTVSIPRGYLENFTVHGATPDRTAPGEVPLPDLEVGDTARVSVELEAVRFGLHRGGVRVNSPNGDVLAVDFRTFILP